MVPQGSIGSRTAPPEGRGGAALYKERARGGASGGPKAPRTSPGAAAIPPRPPSGRPKGAPGGAPKAPPGAAHARRRPRPRRPCDAAAPGRRQGRGGPGDLHDDPNFDYTAFVCALQQRAATAYAPPGPAAAVPGVPGANCTRPLHFNKRRSTLFITGSRGSAFLQFRALAHFRLNQAAASDSSRALCVCRRASGF